MHHPSDLQLLPTDDKALESGCFVDLTLPNLMITFCKKELNIELLEWQKVLIRTAWGWFNKDGGFRFRLISTWLPKKNGKSFFCSLISCFNLAILKNNVFTIAANIKQASIIFDDISKIAKQNKKMLKLLWIRDHIKKIQRIGKNKKDVLAELQVLSSSPEVGGFRADLLICDEIAEWSRNAGRTCWNRLVDSTMANPRGQIFTISTAQFDKDTFAYELYKKCKDVLSGENQDITLLPIVYEVEETEDWTDKENWWKANPSAGHIVPKDYYIQRYESIKGNPLEENQFRTLLLNQWCGSPISWIPTSFWTECKAVYDLSFLKGGEITAGIDYGASFDLTALVIAVKKNGLFFLLPKFYLPENLVEKRKKSDNVPYDVWATEKYLTLTPGNVVDTDFVLSDLMFYKSELKLNEVRFDPTRLEGARQKIWAKGFETIEVSQSASTMSPCFSFFEKIVRDNKLRHPDNPVLNWNLNNCVPKREKDILKIVKSSDYQKIDGIDAACIALSKWIGEDQDVGGRPPEGQSYFEIW